jgi:hypothetical protein
MYVGHCRRQRFVFKHLISGTLGKKISIKKKRDVNDLYKGSIRQLIYKKYTKDTIQVIKLSLCLTKHHVMAVYWGNGDIAPCIL